MEEEKKRTNYVKNILAFPQDNEFVTFVISNYKNSAIDV